MTFWRPANSLAIAWGLVGLFAGIARADAASITRPNFLVIVTDDQRPDTIATLGNPVIETPTLDSLVQRGTTFTRAIAANPICVPSRAEILTGRSGFRNGVRGFSRETMDENLVLWPTAMRAGGYRSWYVGKWMNDGKPTTRGYNETRGLFHSGGGRWAVDEVDWHGRPVTGYKGWVLQTDDGTLLPELGVGLTPDISRHFADAAIDFIERESAAPFFLHVNFTAPHDPLLMPPGYEGKYDPAEIPLPPNFLSEHPFDHGNFDGRDERLLPWPRTPEDVRADLAIYYAVISHMDHHIGRILASLEATGQADNTVVIFTSDHGLAMGSHGLRGKQNMYEHTIGVPLIIAGPGIAGGLRTDTPCYLRDMYPTVCDLADVEIPSTVDARSLVPVLRGESRSVYPHVFAFFRDSQRMIRTERWKLIHYPEIDKYQLFDLKADPNELDNIHDTGRYPEVISDLRAKLLAWQKKNADPVLNE